MQNKRILGTVRRVVTGCASLTDCQISIASNVRFVLRSIITLTQSAHKFYLQMALIS